MIIVGEDEENNNNLSVRQQGGVDLDQMSMEDFASIISKEVEKMA